MMLFPVCYFAISLINMSSDESDQSESEFYYLDEMANDDNEKENIAVITSEENQEDIPAEELNILICRYMMEIKKKHGSAYEPATVSCFQRSLQRCLNDKNSNINILKDQEFQKFREVLLSKKKQLLVEQGKGNHPQATTELTDAEEGLLFRSSEFGDKNPLSSTAHSLVVISTELWCPCKR